jgi:GLPGLI family protein
MNLKKQLLLFFVISIPLCFSQKVLSGEIQYKFDRYQEEGEVIQFKETVEAIQQLEYRLKFNDKQALFELVEKLYVSEKSDELQFAELLGGYQCYKDLETNEKFEKTILDDKIYFVSKPVSEYTWEITGNTKTIAGYKCYQAKAVKKTNDFARNRELTFNIVAWFAPEIPAPFGPKGIDGLPGLVLEATFNGRLYYYASQISLNTSKTVEKLAKPELQNVITEREFDILVGKSYQSMIENRN